MVSNRSKIVIEPRSARIERFLIKRQTIDRRSKMDTESLITDALTIQATTAGLLRNFSLSKTKVFQPSLASKYS